MGSDNVDEITRAIAALGPRELDELYDWLDQHGPERIDARIESDLAEGRLDAAMQSALDDERNGRTRPL